MVPARPQRPRDKALVEAAVNVVYTPVLVPLCNRTFTTLYELNEALWEYLDFPHSRPMQKVGLSRRGGFDSIEAPELRVLPAQQYERRQCMPPATVQTNYHAYFRPDKHFYSVPYRYRALNVQIAYTDREVEIYQGNVRIAVHRRDPQPHQYTTNRFQITTVKAVRIILRNSLYQVVTQEGAATTIPAHPNIRGRDPFCFTEKASA